MKHIVLNDWVLVRGATAIATITQGETTWAEVGDYDDAVFFLTVRAETMPGTLMMAFQTSPSKDDISFQNLAPPFTVAKGTTATTVLGKYSAVPLARYIRWQIYGAGGTYDVMFRLLVAVS
jgi:hypothetical protein